LNARELSGVFARWRGMKDRSAERVTLTPAQRGRIIQRIIVDGWSNGEAAAAAGVPERLVEAWVADYRRRGMASLHHSPSKTIAAEVVQVRLLRPVGAVFRMFANAVRWFFAAERPLGASPLRRSNDDRGGS
jgi:hypothetical protein